MNRNRSFVRGVAIAVAALSSLALGACSTSSSSPSTAAPATELRIVHGSPDAGGVDAYVYAQGKTRPSKPTFSANAYPQITAYSDFAPGTYTVDVISPAGSASTTTPIATKTISLLSKTQYSVAIAGEVANKSLQFLNFVEPAETAGTSALVVHHASPLTQTLIGGPAGFGVYDASQPIPASVAALFTFSVSPGTSGPAASGAVSGGEYFLTPIPSSFPTQIGFAAGTPAGTSFAPVATATLSTLASGLASPTAAQTALAGNSASTCRPATTSRLRGRHGRRVQN